MTEQNTTLPCPFCGGSAVVTARDAGFRVECANRYNPGLCPVNMRTHHHWLEDDAVAAWNTRYSERPRNLTNAAASSEQKCTSIFESSLGERSEPGSEQGETR